MRWTFGVTITSAALIAAVEASELETAFVDVDGATVRVITAGLEGRDPKSPVVVFQSGAGTPAPVWGRVLTGVSGFAPLVAYDRPGIGDSASDGVMPSPAHVNAHLERLLATLELSPPYILVGHSWGGPLIRHFAGEHPDDVVGMVYVDPSELHERHWIDGDVLQEIGLGHLDVDSLVARMDSLDSTWLEHAPEGVKLEREALRAFFETAPETRYGPNPEVPTSVLLAARYEPMPEAPEWLDERYHDAAIPRRVDRFRELVWNNPEATLVLATHAGHFVHDDDPELVIEAVRRVRFPSITRRLRLALAEDGPRGLAGAFRQVTADVPPERVHEEILNAIGYELIGQGELDDAISVLRLNVAEFPDAHTAWETLAEAYVANGDTTEAISCFRESLKLHPGETYAAGMVQRLGGR